MIYFEVLAFFQARVRILTFTFNKYMVNKLRFNYTLKITFFLSSIKLGAIGQLSAIGGQFKIFHLSAKVIVAVGPFLYLENGIFSTQRISYASWLYTDLLRFLVDLHNFFANTKTFRQIHKWASIRLPFLKVLP